MTFVFPVLLGGLLLAGIPILLHLIMRQKPKTLLFPAFRFLLQRHRTNQRKLRLRHLLLLILRVLLIVAIVLALARPKLFDVGFSLHNERPVAAVFVFDTSASMDYKTSDQVTRLEEAKKRGLELLNELPNGSRVAVLDTADSGPASKSEWLATRQQMRERIGGLRIAPVNHPVTHRLDAAYTLLRDLAKATDDPEGVKLPRLLVVFSDRTRGAWETSRLDTTGAGNLHDLADQVPPPLEGLQQARGNIPNLKTPLKELLTKLPAAAGPEQPLLDDLDKLLDRIPALGPDDFPLNEEFRTLITTARGRTRAVLKRLPAADQLTDDLKDYRAKLATALERNLADLAGVLGLWVDVGVDQPADLAITELEPPRLWNGQMRQVFGADEKIPLRVHLQATGRNYERTTLLCNIGRETYKQAVILKAGDKTVLPFEIDAKKLNLLPGPHQVEVRIDPRDLLLPFNDVRYFTFQIREPRKVLLVTDDFNRTQDLEKVLKSLSQNYQPEVKRFSPDLKLPGDYKVVFLVSVAKPSPELWKQLDDYVQQGGGLGVIPGDQDMDVAAYHKGADNLLPGKFSPKPVKRGNSKRRQGGAEWNLKQVFKDSLLQRFRDYRHDKKIDFILNPRQTFQYWEVKAPKEYVLVNYNDDQSRPALLERKVGQGRVVLFTTLLDYIRTRTPEEWNNYLEGNNSFYLTLVALVTNHLAGNPDQVDLNFLAGKEQVKVRLPAAPRFANYYLTGGPEQMSERLTVRERQTEYKHPQPVPPGNFTIQGARDLAEGSTRVASFSVNLPAAESDLTRVPPPEIEALLGAGSVLPIDRKANLRDVLQGHWSQPVELFPFLMVLLLLVLAVENLLSNKFYKQEPAEEEGAK